MGEIDGYYPLTVHESRYSGAYSHGDYVLFAGLKRPRESTDAFAADTPCNKYWQAVRECGPIMTYNPEEGRDNRYIVLSGNSPEDLIERARGIAEVADNE